MANLSIRNLVLIGLLLAAVPAAHLLPGFDSSAVEQQIRDAGHVVGFAAVAWILYEILPYGLAGKVVAAFGGAMLIGVIAELAQKLAGHFFNPYDIARDAVGAGLMILARVLWEIGESRASRLLLRSVAAISAGFVFAPLLYWGWAFWGERLKAPVIMDFEGRFTDLYYAQTNSRIELKQGDALDGRYAEIMLGAAPRSGIRISPAVYDWRAWDHLVFDAEIVSGSDVRVSIHINDYDHIGHFADTPAGMVTVRPGLSSYRIPVADVIAQAARADDPANIRRVAIFARSRNRGTILRIDNIRLE